MTFTLGENSISEFTECTISVIATDYAGNTGTAGTAENFGTYWTYTTVTPTVKATLANDSAMNDVGWTNADSTTVDIQATENNAGINTISYSYSNDGGTTDTADDTEKLNVTVFDIDTWLQEDGNDDATREDVIIVTSNVTFEGSTQLPEGTTTLSATSVSNAGITGSTTESLTIKVDRTDPKFTSGWTPLNDEKSNWVKETSAVTATLTDALSGVRLDTIKVYPVDSATATSGTDITGESYVKITASAGATDKSVESVTASSSYTITISDVRTVSYFYITAEDMAGNTISGYIVADNIDTTTPATPVLTASEDGSTNFTTISESWYTTSTTKVQITADVSDTYKGASDVTLYYEITDVTDSNIKYEGNTSTSAAGFTGSTLSITTDAIAAGKYNIKAWTETAAGITGTAAEDTIWVDYTAPVIDETTITVSGFNGTLSALANFFKFGNFFNKSLTVTMSGWDNQNKAATSFSSVAAVSYKVGTGDWKTANLTETVGSETGEFTFSFQLDADELTSGTTILLKATDEAGNTSEEITLKATKITDGSDSVDGQESTVWMIDTTKPSITGPTYKVSAADGADDAITTAGYYNAGTLTIGATVGDSYGSGVYLVAWEVTGTDPDDQTITGTDMSGITDYSTDEDTASGVNSTVPWSYTFPKDGTYSVKLTVTDNANNTTSETWSNILVDSTAPTGTFSAVGDTENDIDAYFDITKNATWLTDEQTVNFTLTDNFSGIDVSTITLTVDTNGDGIADQTITADDGTWKDMADSTEVTASFTVTENGTYTLSWYDVAGNQATSKVIKVTNVDITNVASPAVKIDPDNGTGNAVTTGGTVNWYTTSVPTVTITPNLTSSSNNGSDEYTMYQLWNANAGASSSDTTTYATSKSGKVEIDSTKAVTISGDGEWHLVVWNQDDAHNTKVDATYNSSELSGGATEYVIYVDTNAPTSATPTSSWDNANGTTNGDVTITFKLDDGYGSGVDESSLELTWVDPDDETTTNTFAYTSLTRVDNGDGTWTVSYVIKANKNPTSTSPTNGKYTLSFKDNAGNSGTSASIEVTAMDSSSLENAAVFYATTSGSTTTTALSAGETNTVYLNTDTYLHVTGSAALAATWTYSGKLTAPDATQETESYTNSGSEDDGLDKWLDTNLGAIEGKWVLYTKTKTDTVNVSDAELYYYIVIDKTAPVMSNSQSQEIKTGGADVDRSTTNWTSGDVKISFSVSDAKDGVTTVSDIASVVVKTTDGTYLSDTNGAGSGSYELELGSTSGDYSFYVLHNGTYTITVTDKAGNANNYEFTVTNIDKVNPDNLNIGDITVSGTKGSDESAATSTYWYKAEGPTTVTITLPEDDDATGTAATAPYTTYYAYWDVSSTDLSEPIYTDSTSTYTIAYFTSSDANDDGEVSFTLPDGTWEMVFWVKDAAGNESELLYASTDDTTPLAVYTDLTQPTANYGKDYISVAEVSPGINSLTTFGNFFSGGFTVKLSGISDETSGVKTVWYAYSEDSTATTSPAVGAENYAAAEQSGNDYLIKFAGTESLDGYIWVYVEDAAGNITTPEALEVYETSTNGVDTWVIDAVNPQVVLSVDAYTYTSGTDSWYKATSAPTIKATATDESNSSGLASLVRTVTYQANESAAESTVTLTGGGTITGTSTVWTVNGSRVYTVTDTVDMTDWPDGVYTISYVATDNAGNTSTTATEKIKVDNVSPTLTVTTTNDGTDYSYSSTTSSDTLKGYFTLDSTESNWIGDTAPEITLKMQDTTSGLAYETVTVTATDGGSVQLSGEDATDTLTFTTNTAAKLEERTCSFYICTNGTYEIVATDAAGNTTSYEFEVTNVDISEPAQPTVAINPKDPNGENSWYNTSYPTITVTQGTKDTTGASGTTSTSAAETYYLLWNETTGGTRATATPMQATTNGKTVTNPAITEDGIWHLVVYTADTAGHTVYAEGCSTTEDIEIKVDIDNSDTTTIGSAYPALSGDEYTSGNVEVTFSFNDGYGSGIDISTVTLSFKSASTGETSDVTETYKSELITNSRIDDGTKSGTLSFTIEANEANTGNGEYTLTWKDMAGNTHTSETYNVSWMDATSIVDAWLPTMEMNQIVSYTTTVDDVEQHWYNYNEDVLTLEFTSNAEGYTGTSSLTTTVTITSPSGVKTVYTITKDNTSSKGYSVTVGGDSTNLPADLYTNGFTAFDEEGKWTVDVTVTNGSNLTNSASAVYYIDRTPPTTEVNGEDTISGNTSTWSNGDKLITFQVEDPETTYSNGYVSGVKAVYVTATDGGSFRTAADGNPITEQTKLTMQSDGSYQFYAVSNGTYTLTLVDNAGNSTTKTVVVTRIDTTAPEDATVAIQGTAGTVKNKDDDSIFGWYKIDTGDGTTANQVIITANEQADNYDVDKAAYAEADTGDTSKVYTWVALWKDGTDDPTEDGTSTTNVLTNDALGNASYNLAKTLTDGEDYYIGYAVLDEDQTITIDMAEGVWNLMVWTTDDAGNQTDAFLIDTDEYDEAVKLYVDETVPDIDNTSLTITEVDSIWDTIVNFLKFGNFLNNEIGITVDVTDATSTPAQLYYYVSSDGDNAPDPDEVDYNKAKMSATGGTTETATFTFDLEDADNLLNGYIWVYAVDDAGNARTPFALKAYTDGEYGSDYWMIDTVEPTIRVTLTDTNDIARTGSWFSSVDETEEIYPVVWATFREGFTTEKGNAANVSGFYSIVREIQVLTGYDGDEPVYETLDGTETDIFEPSDSQIGTDEGYYISDYLEMDDIYGLEDGEYRVLYTVTDNAGNVTMETVSILVDTTDPTGEIDTSDAELEDPVNTPQPITVKA